MSTSPKHIDKSYVLRLICDSEYSVRKAGFTPTSLTFDNKAKFRGVSTLKYNQILCTTNFSYLFDIVFNNTQACIVITNLEASTTKRIILDYSGGNFRIVNWGTTTSNAVLFTPTLGVKYQCVLTAAGNVVRFYVDGSLVYSATLTTRVQGNKPLQFGLASNNANTNFDLYNFNQINRVLSSEEVSNLYNKINYSKLPAIIKDYTPSCFEGNNNAYIEVPDSDLLSFGDGVNDSPFWVSCWCKLTADIQYLISKYGSGAQQEWVVYKSAPNSIQLYLSSNFSASNLIRVNVTLPSHALENIIFSYDGRGGVNAHLGITTYIGKNQVENQSSNTGTYVAMNNGTNPIQIGAATKLKSGSDLFDIRIGSGTLTQSQVNDIYAGRAVGTERLWLPLCENAGNVRFDVSGNGLHGILKGTQDGKYNVGRQNVFDYYRMYGGSTKALMSTSLANDGNTSGTMNEVKWSSNVVSSLTQWAVAIRMIGYLPKDDDFLFTNSGANNYSSIFLRRASGVGANIGFRNNTGVETSFGITSASIQDSYKSLIFRSNGTNIFLSVNGATEVSITPTNVVLLFNVLNGFNATTGNGCNGYFWDLRTWSSDIGNTEALLYHTNQMTVTPDHAYSLIGDNPPKDLVGLVGNIDGVVNAVRPIAIPLQASNQQPVLPEMTVTNPNEIVLKRDIKEVFRVNPSITGNISDVYGNPLTVNGNVSVKQYGKVKGVNFGGSLSDYITCTRSSINEGCIVKCWVKPNNLNGVIFSDGYTRVQSYVSYRFNLSINNSSSGISSINNSLKFNNVYLVITCQDKEKAVMYLFNKSGYIFGSYLTSMYNVGKLQSIFIGQISNVNPFKGTIFDLSISTAGILTLEEAWQIYNSEKQLYY